MSELEALPLADGGAVTGVADGGLFSVELMLLLTGFQPRLIRHSGQGRGDSSGKRGKFSSSSSRFNLPLLSEINKVNKFGES